MSVFNKPYSSGVHDVFIDTSHGRVHGKMEGPPDARLTMIAIHGDGAKSDWHAWEPIMAPLASQGLNILSLSMPGFGESTGSKDAFRDQVQAVDVIRQVIDSLALHDVVLAGRSVGGKIACQGAATLPEVKALVLTHPVCPSNKDFMASIAIPTLITWAKDDASFYTWAAAHDLPDVLRSAGHPYNCSNGAKWFERTIPGCKLPGAGLLSWVEKRRYVAAEATLDTYQGAIATFYATDYCDAVLTMLHGNSLL